MLYESDEITQLKGIGAKKAEAFALLGIRNVGELVAFFPHTYSDRGNFTDIDELCEGGRFLVRARYVGSSGVSYFQNKSKVTLKFENGGKLLRAVYFNQPYMRTNLTPEAEYILYAPVLRDNSGLYMLSPQTERYKEGAYLSEGLFPVYALGAKAPVRQKEMALSVRRALENITLEDDTPEWIKSELKLPDRLAALKGLHSPASVSQAKEAMRFFKLRDFIKFRIMLGKIGGKREEGEPLKADISEYLRAVGFELTGAQKRSLGEILSDMACGKRMNRLLQGDVGSGKTAVAGAAAYTAAVCLRQTAFTAPTEILARQHYEKYKEIFSSLGIQSTLLCSAMKPRQRAAALEDIKSGRAAVIFGTHSVFSADVAYKNLALIIIDEQQRYGVRQRAALEEKGQRPHVLVMSATPIPRTLCLSLYKDLSISIIDEMPAGRKEVKSFVVNSSQTEKIYAAIRQAAQKNLKSFIVCPAIDSADMENVNETYEEARQKLHPYKVRALTAKTSAEEKQRIMESFAYGDVSVVIATSVIEVGIDVKEAVLMWIKGSERFGLSQLHQLRGRIGRGDRESVCFFQTDSSAETAVKRLTALAKTCDGFEIAKQDLKIRGSGEILGVRQSGRGIDIMQDVMDYEELFIASEDIYARLKAAEDKKSRDFFGALEKASAVAFGGIALN